MTRLVSSLFAILLATTLSCSLTKQRSPDPSSNPQSTSVQHEMQAALESKHRVLILGDSISIGYTPIVKNLLQADTVVTRPNTNCAGTNNGVRHIDAWLTTDGGNFDLIWFNFGLHDLKRVGANGKNSNDPDDQRQAEPDVYERQLRQITKKLKATGAALVFATTTPIPKGGVRPHRDLKDPEHYNDIARRICADNDIAVCDLYALAMQHQAQIQPKVDVHFTKAGSALLGKAVADAIHNELRQVTLRQ